MSDTGDMSDTPRTDAEIEKNDSLKGIRFVTISFGRQLERELAAERERANRLEAMLFDARELLRSLGED